MPVLILCAMTASALESPDISADELDAPVRGIGWLMVATLAFALVPVQDGDTKEWSLGVLQNPGQYAAVLSFGIGGLILYHLLCRRWRGSRAFARRMTAVVLAFACVFSMVHIGIGKFGQWHTDSDLVEQYTSAIKLKDDLPEGDWRVDTYKTHDNLGLWLDKSSLQYFGSTAAPSILSFYPALGVKRDVRSEPDISNYALRGLLSVKYLITTPEKQEDFLAAADDGWSYYDTKDGFMLYENENYVPMGFTYDYYITEESYETTVKNTRANLLMRALVLSEEDAEAYGKYLEKLPEAKLDDLWYDTYVSDCADRRASACSSFRMTNSGFHAEITLKKRRPCLLLRAVRRWIHGLRQRQRGRYCPGGRGADGRPGPGGGEHHRLRLSGRRLFPGQQGLAGSAGGIRPIRRVFCLEEKETLLNRGLSMRILP